MQTESLCLTRDIFCRNNNTRQSFPSKLEREKNDRTSHCGDLVFVIQDLHNGWFCWITLNACLTVTWKSFWAPLMHFRPLEQLLTNGLYLDTFH